MITTRRTLITGMASLLVAPAIVRASSIMPVRAWDDAVLFKCTERFSSWTDQRFDPDHIYKLRWAFAEFKEIVCVNVLNYTGYSGCDCGRCCAAYSSASLRSSGRINIHDSRTCLSACVVESVKSL